MASRKRTILIWSAVAGIAAFGVILVVAIVMLAPSRLKPMIERTLSERLGLAVTIDTLSLSLRPHPTVSGTRLIARMPSRPDLPPFLTIESFWVNVGVFSALRGHVGTLHVDGFEVAVPPRDARETMIPPPKKETDSDIVVELLEAHDARLTIVRSKPGQPPLVFKIHDLLVRDVGFGRQMPYDVSLTNAVPEGEVHAVGSVGPWQRGDPASLPISGDYTFKLANLDTIKGIGGMLASAGKFDGQLTQITATGTSETPDFNLDLGGKPVPLSASFKVVVDGSDGRVKLDQVDAKILSTNIKVTGMIDNLPGPGRHDIKLAADIADGRIEDLLTLVMDGAPMLSGKVQLKSTVALPPGPGKSRDRLQMNGKFTLDRGLFTDKEVASKLLALSRRSQGKQDDDEDLGPPERVFTKMGAGFTMRSGTVTLAGLTFAVPGALVSLDGTYAMQSTEIALLGTLRMDATVSQAMGGFKSIFLKPFDQLFKKDGAGAVIPIQITGMRQEPKVGVRMGKLFSGGDEKKKPAGPAKPVPGSVPKPKDK